MLTRKSLTAKAARLLLAGAVLFGASQPAAPAHATLPIAPMAAGLIPAGLHGAWRLTIVPDTAAVRAGKVQIEDYLYIDGTSITSQEITRLGMETTGGSATDASGTVSFTHNLNSRHHGSVVSTGTCALGRMSGTLKWTISGTVYTYNFTGVPYTPEPAESSLTQ